jgi:hypothetical protein
MCAGTVNPAHGLAKLLKCWMRPQCRSFIGSQDTRVDAPQKWFDGSPLSM